jgi:hypothetical protein
VEELNAIKCEVVLKFRCKKCLAIEGQREMAFLSEFRKWGICPALES